MTRKEWGTCQCWDVFEIGGPLSSVGSLPMAPFTRVDHLNLVNIPAIQAKL